MIVIHTEIEHLYSINSGESCCNFIDEIFASSFTEVGYTFDNFHNKYSQGYGLFEKGIDKIIAVEWSQIGEAFANTYISNRKVHFLGYPDDNSAF